MSVIHHHVVNTINVLMVAMTGHLDLESSSRLSKSLLNSAAMFAVNKAGATSPNVAAMTA